MNSGFLNRDAVLAATGNGYRIFDRYLSPLYPGGRIEAGRNISNPFLPEPQKTPSFNLYQDSSGVWRFKDFADDDCSGDAFDFVAQRNGLNSKNDFPAVLQTIGNEFGLDPGNGQAGSTTGQKPFSLEEKPFDRAELDYWAQSGIDPDTLDRFGVRSLKSYTTTGKNGKSYTVTASAESPMFAYPYGPDSFKIYRAFESGNDDKFRFLGEKPAGSVWGLAQLPERCDTIILAAGEKDALTAAANGFYAVTLNSETARLNQATVRALLDRAERVVCCYDTDETGQKAAARIASEHRIVSVFLPSWIADGEGKDLSDFFKLGGTAEELRELIAEAVANPPSCRDTEGEKSGPDSGYDRKARFISLGELLDSTEEEEPFLVENILPAVGVSAIVGIPDGGKSQFTRQLALTIVTGDSFLGLKVTARHRRAIIIITEESTGQVRESIRKQLKKIGDVPPDAIDILAANTLTHDEIIEALTERLRQAPADLVIADSFGDMFPGRDPNSTAEMRKALKPFDAIAQRFSTAILFVNHLGKAGYRASPDQSQVINSAAFVQKCRSVIDLRYEAQDQLTKFLSITKGNGVSVKVKERAMVLLFDEATLTFTFTKGYKLVSEINADPANEARSQMREVARQLCRDGKSIRQIEEMLKVPKSTVGEWVKGVRPNNGKGAGQTGQPDGESTSKADSVSG